MVTLILVNMGGLMWLWNISLNAVSLVNLVVVSIIINRTSSHMNNFKLTMSQYFSGLLHFSASELV